MADASGAGTGAARRRAGLWLAGGAAVALLVALALLRGALSAPPEPAAARVAPPVGSDAPAETRGVAPPRPAALPAGVARAVEAAARPAKLDPQSDEFFNRFDDAVPAILTRNAASCYTGGLQRKSMNQKLKLTFKTHIHDGEVTLSDVKVAESTLNDPALEACFVAKVAASRWHDDELPEWTQDDELVIRPERGMKKFTEENLRYEGSGPIGPSVMKVR